MGFLLEKLKELGTEDEEAEERGFNDLNYKVGNTSGMDVTGQIPSELAERVGQLAQRGGGEMEIQVENPSTFHIDREDLLNVVNGLELDISIHSDPNVGYTSPYQVGGGGGFDGTHNYFTQYLEAFTSMKLEAENRDDLKFGEEIEIGRINPHVSVSPLPQTEQERAQGVGLDPLGFVLTNVEKNDMRRRRKEGKNIYDNPEFLRKFYRLFVVNEIGENEYRYFDNFYIPFSNKFDKSWREAQNEVLKDIYNDRTSDKERSPDAALKDRVSIIRVVARADPAISTEWFEIIDDKKYSFDPIDTSEYEIDITNANVPPTIETLKDLEILLQKISINYKLTELSRLPRITYFIRTNQMEQLSNRPESVEFGKEFENILWERIRPMLTEALDDLWESKPRNDQKNNGELDGGQENPRVSLIPVNAKIQAVSDHLEIPQRKILEKAFTQYSEHDRADDPDLRDEIEAMFAGETEYFENGDDRSPKERHENFIRTFVNNLEQQIWQESHIFYRIVPAWISSSEITSEGEGGPNHKGWMAPKFLWKVLVERTHDKKYGGEYDLDLTDPRKEDGYIEALESREFQMDVAAAVAGTYMWSMFTQVEKEMEIEGKRGLFDSDKRKCTWIEWMNDYGIGVNMETMAGAPRQLFKLWRPKDVVAACRAINITARRRAENQGLGGLNSINPKLDECPVKFTIDMEHVSSFGVDPLKEMKILRDQEKDLLENPVEIEKDGKVQKIETPGDPETPLAKMVRMYHLTKPGHETTSGVGHTHGPFRKGDTKLYEWLYRMVEWGFGRGEERASVMYEVGGEQTGTVYQAKLAMDMITIGIDPEKDLDPARVKPGENYDSREEALLARFFNMDKANYSSEWSKIEQHAFDPLEGLLEAEQFDYTYSGRASLESDNQPQDWMMEEYR